MKRILFVILALAIVLCGTPAYTADHCPETSSIQTLEYGLELTKVERRCDSRAAVNSMDEYKFSLPKNSPYVIYIEVDMNRSDIPLGCNVFLKSVVVRAGSTSTIRVDSEDKTSMPAYNLVFHYGVTEIKKSNSGGIRG